MVRTGNLEICEGEVKMEKKKERFHTSPCWYWKNTQKLMFETNRLQLVVVVVVVVVVFASIYFTRMAR